MAVLQLGTPETDKKERLEFEVGMREHGYVDGKHYILEEAFAAGKPDNLREIIGGLLVRKPAVLVVNGSQAVRAAKAATATVPIVVVNMADPVGQGVIASLSRPGGNITGTAILSEVLVAKRLEILLEAIPTAKKIGYLTNPANPVSKSLEDRVSTAASGLGKELIVFYASTGAEIEKTLAGIITRRKVDAMLIGQDATAFHYRSCFARTR